MTKLTESATYSPTIFRLETTTPVAGGAVVLDGNDDPVQGHANAQAQLLANRTKYLKGITDTLGTAAVANVTTSTTDTTAGRVLKVGDFGLGGLATTFTDFDSQMGSTASLFGAAENTALNTPLGITGEVWVCVYTASLNANRGDQFAKSLSSGRIFSRVRLGSVTGAWRELWTSSGLNAITVDTGSFGYGTGAGGTVTQATSKTTAVTLNKPSGQITTTGDALAANTAVSFTLTNNKIAANDIPLVVIKSGATAGAYVVTVDAVVAGSCRISIRNMTAGSLSEALVLQFNIEKGAIA